MAEHSRRSFLVGAGAGAVAVTAVAVAPSAMAATKTSVPTDAPEADASTGTLVAYVKDAASGEITVMSGDREIVVKDRKLAQKLARLAD
jgi:hypothetical protein